MNWKEGFRCDLHIHSCLSPCADLLMTPGNIIKTAAELGLNCIAITDHNSAGNVQVAYELASQRGIKLVPAMEVETREEVHLLCYFPELDALLEWENIVSKHLPELLNNEEIFGYQLLTDLSDQYIAKEERLLAVATELSLAETVTGVTNLGGFAVPAHVDRPRNSILRQLGFIPDGTGIRIIEISRNTSPEEFLHDHPELSHYPLLQSSDSHQLPEIGRWGAEKGFVLNEKLFSIMSQLF